MFAGLPNRSDLLPMLRMWKGFVLVYKKILYLLHCGTLFISLPADTISQSAPLNMDETGASKGRSDETQLREFYKQGKTSNC